ncbi:MAG: hypothetical protein B9S34_15875 [Opitutia bacterium Tous-C1TDCM]|nr:MAG: hypothetical protein B9S34_15875 [Opitutae bacterium Tous-C1TDCM]
MVTTGSPIQRCFPRAVILLVALGAAVSGRAQRSDIAGTMPEDYLPELKPILAAAIRQSPQVIGAQFEIAQREAYRIRDDSPRLPSFRADVNFANTETSISSDNSSRSRDNGLFYSVGLSQALFHWGALKNQSAAARLSLESAEKSAAKVYRELSVLLRQAYLDLIVRKARLRHARESHRLLTEAVAVSQERFARGAISTGELEGEKLRVREAALELARAEGDFEQARRGFVRLSGAREVTEATLPETIPAPGPIEPLAEALGAALRRDNAGGTLEAAIFDLKIKESLLRYRIESVRLFPKFFANAGYSLENTTNVNANAVNQQAVARQTYSISAQWAIFDGFATRAAKMEARSTQRYYEVRKSAELEALLQQAQHLERQLKLDREQLELAEIRRGLAIEGRRRIAEEAALGNLPKGDVERAEVGILQAEAARLAARAALLGRWSEYVAVAGNDPILNSLPVRYAPQ